MKKLILLSIALFGLTLTSCNDGEDFTYTIINETVIYAHESTSDSPADQKEAIANIKAYTDYMLNVVKLDGGIKTFKGKNKAEADQKALDFFNAEMSRIDNAKINSFLTKKKIFNVHQIFQMGSYGNESTPTGFGDKKEFGDLTLKK